MIDNYVSLYLQSAFATADPNVLLSLFFLFLGRMFPIIALSPFFGSKILPHPVKVALGICFFALFLPQLLFVTKTPLTFDITLVNLMIKELFIGTLMGFLISLPFMIVQNAGILIDHQRGGASLMVNDPTVQTQSSPLGTMFNFMLIVLFFRIDGPFLVLDVLGQSFEALPPDRFLSSEFFKTDSPFPQEVFKIMGQMMIISTRLAAPALIIILMTDFFLGIANRLAPQVQITFLGMPLKSLLALAIVFFGWELLMEEMVKEAYVWIRYLGNFTKMLIPSTTV